MREYTIYTAGAMGSMPNFEAYHNWRMCATKLLKEACKDKDVDLLVINPSEFYNFEEVRHKSELEVMKFDLGAVKKSDVLLVNLEGINTSIGTAIEVYEAWKQDVPVIAFGKLEGVHPWLVNCIYRHEENMILAIEYVRDFLIL